MLRHMWMVSLLVLLAACGSSPKTDFYMLSADQGSVMQAANLSTGPSVGVWQVVLPDLLDRAEIVTSDNPFKITMADFSWWAGSLNENMTLLIVTQLIVSPYTPLSSNSTTMSGL